MGISLETLDQITAILGAHLHLKLIPGAEWGYDNVLGRIQYPRKRLLELTRERATGELWRTVQHAKSSRGELDAYEVAVDAVVATDTLAGHRVMHARYVTRLMHAAEVERVEVVARSVARNLGNTYLPVRWQGWRAPEESFDRGVLRQPAANGNEYWQRAAVALGAIASGALSPDHLPADLAWPAPVIDQIIALPKLETYDELLERVEEIVPALTRTWLDSMAAPKEPEPEPEAEPDPSEEPDADDGENPNQDGADSQSEANDSQTNEESDQSDEDDSEANGAPEPDSGSHASDENGTSTTGDTAAPCTDRDDTEDDAAQVADTVGSEDDAEHAPADDETDDSLADAVSRIVPELLEAIAKEIAALGTSPIAIDYFENDSAADPDVAEHPIQEMAPGWGAAPMYREDNAPGPAWAAVSRSNARVAAPLRRLFTQFLAENEIGEMMRGQTSGRLNRRVAMTPDSKRPPFKRRRETHDRSWAVALVLDHSGSMFQAAPGTPYPEAFGDGPLQRWHLVSRLGVALLEVLDRIPGASTAAVCYDHEITIAKRVNDRLTTSVRQTVMDHVVPRGDNNDAGALRAALAELRRSTAESKLLLHLTDGQFCSSEADMIRVTKEIRGAGVEWVVLTLGIGPDFARRFVPAHLAEEITDDTIGAVLTKHLRRMIEQAAA